MRSARRPRLIPKWRLMLRYAWSVRLIFVAGLLAGAQAVLPFLTELIPPRILAVLTFVIVMGALVSQFIVQQKISGDE